MLISWRPWAASGASGYRPVSGRVASLFRIDHCHVGTSLRSAVACGAGLLSEVSGNAASAGTPSAWLRRWLHPLAVACEKHRTWLEPVTAKRLREIRRISDVAGSPRSSPPDTARQRRRELALIDGALWLEALVINSPHHYPPWGIIDVGQRAKILRSLVQV
jgi:hypothetical protein